MTEAAAVKTASEDLLTSKNAETIADSEALKSLKDAAERMSDVKGVSELHTLIEEISSAVSLLPEEAKKGGANLTSEIKAVSEAVEKTETALTVANEGAKAFNLKRRKFYNKLLADTMQIPEIDTW